MENFDMYIEKSGMDKKSYQREGVQWLLENETSVGVGVDFGIRGGFVADEMGLGKTIMMIGLCVANFRKKTLIVVPPVLIDQWFRQIYKTTGHKCVVFHGKNKKKLLSLDTFALQQIFEQSVIVLCSYEAISVKIDKKHKKKVTGEVDRIGTGICGLSILHDITWGRVIFDEAHHLRNKNTGRFMGGKMLRSEIKWLVSGTPIQNKKQDFYALCSLINLPVSYYKDASNYGEIAERFILKRTKKQVGIDLDDAVETKNIVIWKNKAEEMLAKEIHSAFAFSNVAIGSGEVNIDSDGKKYSHEFIDAMLNRGYGKLPILLRARQSCIYPKMMKDKIEIFKKMGIIKEGNGDGETYEEAMKHSSKLDSVVEAIMERKDNGNGKLVFCHFKEEMTVIAERLRGVLGGMVVGILDGKTSGNTRMKLLSEPKDVLIMQIQTGCEGLNLQDNYNEVYFVSPHWNPYVEEQAIARCHRIGQMKPVFVWRFEMDKFADTGNENLIQTKNLEEYVADVQNDKRILVSKIIE
jgi:SNF2 family DNA or RNA helicase